MPEFYVTGAFINIFTMVTQLVPLRSHFWHFDMPVEAASRDQLEQHIHSIAILASTLCTFKHILNSRTAQGSPVLDCEESRYILI